MIIRIFYSIILICLLGSVTASAAGKSTITVLSYNVRNYFVEGEKSGPPKSEKSRNAVAATIASSAPDIVLLYEIGGKAALLDLAGRLQKLGQNYLYSDCMTEADSWRYIGVLAKFAPGKVEKIDNLTYNLRPKNKRFKGLEQVPVQRGFFHLVFVKGSYRLNILSAHLKARLFHPRYNQTDMRRMEARLLRKTIENIMKKQPDANLLVVGDLNDVYSSDPLRTIKGENVKKGAKLADLKPEDMMHCTWTHWWNAEDSYGRIDYALASKGLLPEVEKSKSAVIHLPSLWITASDHRPVLTVIHAEETGNTE